MGATDTFRIAVLSDLHIGGTTDLGFQNPFFSNDARETVGPTVEAVNRAEPDLVLVSGDLTQNATVGEVVEARAFLDRLAATYVVCRGNHDNETPEGERRFDDAFAGETRASRVRQLEMPGASGVAVFGLESTWAKSGAWNQASPPLAEPAEADVERAYRDLECLKPSCLLVLSHYPLVSQAEYVASVGGKYAGHVLDGNRILDTFTRLADTVICLVGHNHYHHIMVGERWLQIATGAVIEYPSEFRMLSIGADEVAVTTLPGAPEAVNVAPSPANPWVSGRPEDRDFIWRPGRKLRR